MKKIRYFVVMANPVWFVRESWAYMRGCRREFWIGLLPAYTRYVIATFKDSIRLACLLMIAVISASAQLQKTPYERMYEAEYLGDKKAVWQTLTQEEKLSALRQNFSWGIATLNLNTEQIAFLTRISAQLPTVEQKHEIEAEALHLFTRAKANALFGTIGPYKDQCREQALFVKIRRASCPCAIGSYFNMSCSNDCSSPGGQCSQTADGCGFAYLWPCDGNCRLKAFDYPDP